MATNLAVLLKNGAGQQVLPVSKSNLIELLSSTYTGYFSGKIAQADVASALAYIAGTYIPGVAAEAKQYTETKIGGLTYTAPGAAGKAVVAVTEANGIIAPVQGDVYSEYIKYDNADNSTSLKSYLDALTAKDAAIITSYEAADTALGGRIDNLSKAQALKLTKGSDTTSNSDAATGDNLKIGNNGETYKLWQGTTQVAEFKFDEKDSFVESGVTRKASAEDVAAAKPEGGQAPFKEGDWIIVLTLKVLTNEGNNEPRNVYIPAESLVDAYTSGSANNDMVVVAIDQATNKITATLTDGKVTKAKLEAGVQASLGWADSALQGATLNGTSIVSASKIAELTVSVGDTAGSIKINGTNYIPKDLKTIATSALASDAVVKCANGTALATITGSTEDTNVQASLEALAGKVNTIQGGMVTSIAGDAYSNKGVDITLATDNTTGNVKVKVGSSNLDNVATLHYNSVNATTEDFSLYGAAAGVDA